MSYDQACDAILEDGGEAGEWARRVDERQLRRAYDRADDDVTEQSVAIAFRDLHEGQLLFNHDSSRWHVWDGACWRPDRTKRAFNFAVEACGTAVAGTNSKRNKSMLRASAANGVESIARADPVFAVTSDRFDQDPFLLGTPGGTVSLQTGELRLARQGDFITKLTAVSPISLDEFDAERDCPRFLAFLRDATGSDKELTLALQCWFGYNLTGDVREEQLAFIHGPGGSGKSTLINTVGDIVGDYCLNIPIETLTESRNEHHSTEIARLHGSRMAWASETQQGRAWNQKRITELTGGDMITARFMRQDFFSFKPQFKLTIVGNNQPSLRQVDAAIRRRFNVIPFRHPPQKADDTLKAQLRDEAPGILSWLIIGCLEWQKRGLRWPKVVTDYTREYLAEQDTFQQWLDERCEVNPSYADTTDNLFSSWSDFAWSRREDAGNKTQTFPDMMREHGFERAGKVNWARGWKGLRIKPDEDGGLI